MKSIIIRTARNHSLNLAKKLAKECNSVSVVGVNDKNIVLTDEINYAKIAKQLNMSISRI